MSCFNFSYTIWISLNTCRILPSMILLYLSAWKFLIIYESHTHDTCISRRNDTMKTAAEVHEFNLSMLFKCSHFQGQTPGFFDGFSFTEDVHIFLWEKDCCWKYTWKQNNLDLKGSCIGILHALHNPISLLIFIICVKSTSLILMMENK